MKFPLTWVKLQEMQVQEGRIDFTPERDKFEMSYKFK